MNEHDHNDDDFARAARDRLTQDAAQLDDTARRALRLARHRALDAGSARRFAGWMPIAASAAAIALVSVLAIRMAPRPAVVPQLVESNGDVIADIELLAEGEDLALLEELEFYAWLSEADEDLS
jgi:hypothetical protein